MGGQKTYPEKLPWEEENNKKPKDKKILGWTRAPAIGSFESQGGEKGRKDTQYVGVLEARKRAQKRRFVSGKRGRGSSTNSKKRSARKGKRNQGDYRERPSTGAFNAPSRGKGGGEASKVKQEACTHRQ